MSPVKTHLNFTIPTTPEVAVWIRDLSLLLDNYFAGGFDYAMTDSHLRQSFDTLTEGFAYEDSPKPAALGLIFEPAEGRPEGCLTIRDVGGAADLHQLKAILAEAQARFGLREVWGFPYGRDFDAATREVMLKVGGAERGVHHDSAISMGDGFGGGAVMLREGRA